MKKVCVKISMKDFDLILALVTIFARQQKENGKKFDRSTMKAIHNFYREHEKQFYQNKDRVNKKEAKRSVKSLISEVFK